MKLHPMKLHPRILLTVLALGGALATSALAADKPNRPAKDTPAGEKDRSNPLKELNLSEEQKEKVKAARKTMQEKMQEARSGTGSRQEKQGTLRKAREDYSARMKEILTAEQYDTWQKAQPQAPRGGGEKPARKKAQ